MALGPLQRKREPPDQNAAVPAAGAAIASEPGSVASALRVDGVSKRFGDVTVVKDVSLEVAPGTILSLLGPSGCGKTTMLRMIAGFLRPSSGRVRIAGEDVTDVPPHRRKLGMVFQNYSLFPHMTVAENVAFGLKMQGVSRQRATDAVGEALAMVRMGGMEGRFPAELSGGQQQRVALARAVVTRPKLLLLDEPFGALDRRLREQMQIEVKQLQRELGLTFVFVTHDQDEALTLSDRIAVMRAGKIEQIGTPTEIFEAPATQFVAECFGTLNTLPVRVARIEATMSLVEAAAGELVVPTNFGGGSHAVLAVRVSDVQLAATRPAVGKLASLSGILVDTIYKGTGVLCRVKLAEGATFMATADRSALDAFRPGDAVHVTWQADKAFLFPDSAAGRSDATRPQLKDEARGDR